jgi:hypothetical protein
VSTHLGVPDVTSHSFRKSLATLIDDEGLSARIGADHLGHARVSQTQDTYMARGRSHKVVAELLDKAISDEEPMDSKGPQRKTAPDVPPAGFEPATPALGEPANPPSRGPERCSEMAI